MNMEKSGFEAFAGDAPVLSKRLREAIEAAEPPEIIRDQDKAAIEENIKKIYKSFGLPEQKVSVATHQFPATESLRENGPVPMLIVDNEPFSAIEIIQPLSTVTNGHLEFLVHKDQELEQLVAEIVDRVNISGIKMIVMDYDLAKNVMGDQVVAKLREQGIDAKIVARSGNSDAIHAFAQYDVPIAFHKPQVMDTEEEMANIAMIYSDDEEAKRMSQEELDALFQEEPEDNAARMAEEEAKSE